MPLQFADGSNERKKSKFIHRLGAVACAVVLACGAVGCVATAGVETEVVYGYPVVAVAAAPVNIHAYPRVDFRGDYAYLVGERWYYRGPRGWVVFRKEPVELARSRVYITERHSVRDRPRPRYYDERPTRAKEPVERRRRYDAD